MPGERRDHEPRTQEPRAALPEDEGRTALAAQALATARAAALAKGNRPAAVPRPGVPAGPGDQPAAAVRP
ncbi:MAG TPA: hypothetical protein VF843_16145, partial [Streptosporangiaceae bacterium]